MSRAASPKARRAVLLQEMGLAPFWTLRARQMPETERPAEEIADDALDQASDRSVDTGFEAPVDLWIDGPADPWIDAPLAPRPAAATSTAIASMDWQQLEAEVAVCERCQLCHGRKRSVFGVGDRRARWLFIGEGPGRKEDQQGEPFVGPAGKLLDNMLLALDMRRGENVFITNIVKCRPSGADGRDRPPSAEEAAACLPFLERQIALIQPTILVALGKTAALSLLALPEQTTLGSLRGKAYQYAGRPLVVTYHPAYLLRTPADKGKVWADLCQAMDIYGAAS